MILLASLEGLHSIYQVAHTHLVSNQGHEYLSWTELLLRHWYTVIISKILYLDN